MKKKYWLVILAVVCLLSGLAFGFVGIRNTTRGAEYEDLKFIGRLTFEAYAAAQEEDGTYTIYYQTVGSESGALFYERYDVGREEYDSYQFDVAVANADLNAEQIPKATITRYVYTYRKDGELHNAIYDIYKTVEEVAELITDANRVEPLRFYVFGGLLLVCGVYFFILAFSNRKKPLPQEDE